MTLLQAIFLGIVQGCTEFFPVSSSAHLQLAKWFLGIQKGYSSFDLFCHTGTLLALSVFLRKEIVKTVRDPKTLLLFAFALFPLVPAYFLLKPLRTAVSNPTYLGYFLMMTSFLLFAASKKSKEKEQARKAKDVICIGIMQTIALIPGISRSGSTIATARLLGWDWISAARFSFLLSIPTVLGGQFLEMLTWVQGAKEMSLSIRCYVAGFIASFAIGCLSVRLIFWIYEKKYIRPVAWYCLGVGVFALWALHV